MRFVMFYQSIVSCWNHGNAHFLRGVTAELLSRGHEVIVYEPKDNWCVKNMVADHGSQTIADYQRHFPALWSRTYDPERADLDELIDGADLVIVHEWNEPHFVRRLGRHRQTRSSSSSNSSCSSYRLLFHDTHHRAVTAPAAIQQLGLESYDGVLAFGRVLRDLYLERGWVDRAWIWHEAADPRIFHPRKRNREGDLVFIGNFGDGERTRELDEYLLEVIRRLDLRAEVFGVRYSQQTLAAVRQSGASYRGWLPNHLVPEVFARFAVTVHVPRRPYVEMLPGIPTIRPFEALACGIPLVCSSWRDAEGLFEPGYHFLVAENGREMARHVRDILHDEALASELRQRGLAVIADRHTCGHRVDELIAICSRLGLESHEAEAREPPHQEHTQSTVRPAGV